MTDDLDRLKRALRDAPAARDAARQAALRLAAENFARTQETASVARPTRKATLPERIRTMLTSNLRPALYATTCLVVVGAAVMTTRNWQDIRPLGGLTDAVTTEAPVVVEPLVEEFAEAEAEADAVSPAPRLQSKVARSRDAAGTEGIVGAIAAPSPVDARIVPPREENRETFAGAPENPVRVTVEEPVSTFSIDVDTASYAYVRAALLDGQRPVADAVRVEEMVNYFDYAYPAPGADGPPFSTAVAVTATPWNPDTKLVRIGLQGRMPALKDRPPLNLVFLIDTSGSMHDPDKLPLLKQSFRLMLGELRPEDEVAIVTYAGSAGTVLEPTAAGDAATILAALDRLEAGGSTAGQAGLQAAYALAERMQDGGEVSRILLATDGDFNVGIDDPDALKDFVAARRDTGAYLSVLGFGRGNYRDDMMQTLAQTGNGQAAYIDTLAEAQKVLVDQLTGALFPIAGDVKIQVEWNPALVGEYRLIGYETRALNREDFNNDKVDAGEIGAGHQVTALYEITPTGSPALLNDPLRYGDAAAVATDSDELGFLKLRYKDPGASESQLVTTPITETTDRPAGAGWAAAIAGFGQLLKGSAYTGDWTYADAITLAEATKGADPQGLRAEAIRLMKLAETLND